MLTLKGIYGREMYETWYKMSVMIDSGLDISPIITHRHGFSGFPAGLRCHEQRRGQQGRTQLRGTGVTRYGRSVSRNISPASWQAIEERRALTKHERLITTPQGAHVGVARAVKMY